MIEKYGAYGSYTINEAICEFEIACIHRIYHIQEIEATRSYLKLNAFLLPILFTSALKCSTYFPGSKLSLNIDDEYEDDLRLIITIVTTSSADEVFQQLQQFFDQWWLDMPNDAKLKLSFSVEFR